jgi:hypothetical protein
MVRSDAQLCLALSARDSRPDYERDAKRDSALWKQLRRDWVATWQGRAPPGDEAPTAEWKKWWSRAIEQHSELEREARERGLDAAEPQPGSAAGSKREHSGQDGEQPFGKRRAAVENGEEPGASAAVSQARGLLSHGRQAEVIPTRHAKPRGVVPKTESGEQCTWDSIAGCWRDPAPGGGVHQVVRNRKRVVRSEQHRAESERIHAVAYQRLAPNADLAADDLQYEQRTFGEGGPRFSADPEVLRLRLADDRMRRNPGDVFARPWFIIDDSQLDDCWIRRYDDRGPLYNLCGKIRECTGVDGPGPTFQAEEPELWAKLKWPWRLEDANDFGSLKTLAWFWRSSRYWEHVDALLDECEDFSRAEYEFQQRCVLEEQVARAGHVFVAAFAEFQLWKKKHERQLVEQCLARWKAEHVAMVRRCDEQMEAERLQRVVHHEALARGRGLLDGEVTVGATLSVGHSLYRPVVEGPDGPCIGRYQRITNPHYNVMRSSNCNFNVIDSFIHIPYVTFNMDIFKIGNAAAGSCEIPTSPLNWPQTIPCAFCPCEWCQEQDYSCT